MPGPLHSVVRPPKARNRRLVHPGQKRASPVTSDGSARVFDAATGAYLDTVKNQSAATVPAQICLQMIRYDPLTCANDLYRSPCLQMVRRRPQVSRDPHRHLRLTAARTLQP
jgi:hypothetical protein